MIVNHEKRQKSDGLSCGGRPEPLFFKGKMWFKQQLDVHLELFVITGVAALRCNDAVVVQ